MQISIFQQRKLPLILHVMAWAIFFILPAYLLSLNSQLDSYFLFRIYVQTIVYVLIFYINYIWLVPKFFLSGNKRNYFITTVITIAAFYFVIETTNDFFRHDSAHDKRIEMEMDKFVKETHIPRPSKSWHVYNYIFTSFLISGFSLGLRLATQYIKDEKTKKELEQERLNTELAFLKNQISPHFFFNTLNNIYSLVQINANDAQKSILRLSKLMRYLLYESEEGNTLLSREIEFMNNYIDLMKLRLTNKVELSMSFPTEFNDISFPPLLFIPFIENAFKHGISSREHSYIHVSMTIDPKNVEFRCSNSLTPTLSETAEPHSGIGLENVKKRLGLLFPKKHELIIHQTNNSFDVHLTIELNQNLKV
jgi:two-component system, LytTR family, sensor kinase